METTAAFEGLACLSCRRTFDPAAVTHACPECGGHLRLSYDYDAVRLTREELSARPFDSMWRYAELLPFSASTAVTMAEGATPLVECPTLAERLGVERALVKDEGRNPTGTFKDRGQSVAATAALQHGATSVALTSAGNAGQSAAAYAARAGIDAHVFVPKRAGFTQRALTAIHGATVTVADPVGGSSTVGDPLDRYEAAMAASPDWYSIRAFATPYRRAGKTTMGLELLEALGWTPPDAVVYPTGAGVGLLAIHDAALTARALGWIDELPPLYAAQASGCAPIADAWHAGRRRHDPVPPGEIDTVCGGIAIPDPGAGREILDALHASGGGAVATPDEAILDASIDVARAEGLEVAPTSAAAVSGALALAEKGRFRSNDTVVILNTAAGTKDVDVLRSHLGDR